jgi:general stress protein 26
MHTIEMDDNGDLWFFTSMHSTKVKDIKKDGVVNVTYADDDKQVFVSITGIARMMYDKTRIAKLWRPVFKTWFENGVQDPSLILINIKINHAEYWDASEYKMRNILNMFGSLFTGDPMEIVSEHNSYEL